MLVFNNHYIMILVAELNRIDGMHGTVFHLLSLLPFLDLLLLLHVFPYSTYFPYTALRCSTHFIIPSSYHLTISCYLINHTSSTINCVLPILSSAIYSMLHLFTLSLVARLSYLTMMCHISHHMCYHVMLTSLYLNLCFQLYFTLVS